MPEAKRRWTGDEWRWSQQGQKANGIQVIERAEDRDEPANAERVPFGFSRALPVETTQGPTDIEEAIATGDVPLV